MQRMIESTVVRQILKKYESRYNEAEAKWEEDYQAIKDIDDKKHEGQEWTDHQRREFLTEDMQSLNAQLGAYECIIKDLRNLIE